MEHFSSFLGGFAVALAPANLGYAFLVCLMGTVVGVMPGHRIPVAPTICFQRKVPYLQNGIMDC